MKYVREHINEKFTEDSDPIKDLGIGITTFENIRPGDVITCLKDSNFFKFSNSTTFPTKGLYIVKNVERKTKTKLGLDLVPFGYSTDINWNREFFRALRNECISGDYHHITRSMLHMNVQPIRIWKKYFKIYQPRELKESLNEVFTKDSDPIRDMDIGLKHKIRKWITDVYTSSTFRSTSEDGGALPIERIIINDDLTIDVMGRVDFSNGPESFPYYIKFNRIYGDFSCSFEMNEYEKIMPKIIDGQLRFYIRPSHETQEKIISKIKKICKVKDILLQRY